MTRPPARTAILIANGAFPEAQGELAPLSAPSHDVTLLAGVLADVELCRFDVAQKLVDQDAKSVRKTLHRALTVAGPLDLVLIYYAGHGKLDGAQLYLCTHDTEPDALPATSFAISELHHYISRSACKQVVLILDCCFSGAAAEEFQTRGELVDRLEAAAASARGLYLLTSCGTYETSLEHVATAQGDVPYGVYTRALVDGIVSGRADIYQDGRITPLELARYLQSLIPGQTPRVSLIDADGEEPVLAWTGWMQNDVQRKRVREKLAQWYADEALPYEVLHQAMELLGRVPQNSLEKARKRLLGMCAGPGWEEIFTRAWSSLDNGSEDPDGKFERFLTQHVAAGGLGEAPYVEVMRLLAAEPANEFQERRIRLLRRFARSGNRDITMFTEMWQALDRREHVRATDEARPRENDPAVSPQESAAGARTETNLPPDTLKNPAERPAAHTPVWNQIKAHPQWSAAGLLIGLLGLAAIQSTLLRGGDGASQNKIDQTRAETDTASRFYDPTVLSPIIDSATAGTVNDTATVPAGGTRDDTATALADNTVVTSSIPQSERPVQVDSPARSSIDSVLAMRLAKFSAPVLSRVGQMGYQPSQVLVHAVFAHDTVHQDVPDGLFSVNHGGRRFLMTRAVGRAAQATWSAPHDNIIARVNLRYETGAQDNGAGFALRDNITVVVDASLEDRGFYLVEERINDSWRSIIPWTNSDVIRSGEDNVLEIVVIGRNIYVYINGSYVSTATGITTLSGENLRLRVGTRNSTYSFDDFEVISLRMR